MKRSQKYVLGTMFVILLICLVLFGGAFLFFAARGYGVSTGQCLVALNGKGNPSYMVIMDGSPVVMSDRSSTGEMFQGLATGDEILVLHDGINETYPGGTRAYLCIQLEGGSSTGIPQNVVEELTDLGWSVTGVPADNDWGLTLQAVDVTPTGMTVNYTQSGGAPSGELDTGSFYVIEAWEEGEWIPLEYQEGLEEMNIAWTSEAWCIPLNGEVSFEENWEWLYGELPAGKYRIGKSVMDFRGPGDYDEAMFYAEFEIQ